MRQDQDDEASFRWTDSDGQPQDEPHDFSDYRSDDDGPIDVSQAYTGAGKPIYEYDAGNERRFSRRSHSSEPRLPLWFYLGIALLVVLFVTIGVFFASCGSEPTKNSGVDTETALDEQVATTLAGMTTEEKVAQLFFVTPEELTGVDVATEAGDGTLAALTTYPVGGIVYSTQNFQNTSQVQALISTTQSYSKYRLFIGITEESGTQASSAASSGVLTTTATSDASTIGATGDSSQAYSAAHTIGGYLKSLGFNVDFAPLADTNSTGNPRYYGSDAATVADMVQKTVSGLQGQGISATLKYFPGSGDTTTGSTGLPSNNETLEQMQANEFVTYAAGIASGADFVMVGNITVPSVTGNQLPASLSPTIVNDTLRGTLGYDGIVISDAMNTAAFTANYDAGEAAVLFIQAGGDMILEPADLATAYKAVLAAVNDGTISQDRLDQSITRILKVKLASS